MNTNTNKIKSQLCYVATAVPTSGSASLPDGNQMKSNSHLKLTSTWNQNTPRCKIIRLNYRNTSLLSASWNYAKFGKPVQCGVDHICCKHHKCKTNPPYQAIPGILNILQYKSTELLYNTAMEHVKLIQNYIHPYTFLKPGKFFVLFNVTTNIWVCTGTCLLIP